LSLQRAGRRKRSGNRAGKRRTRSPHLRGPCRTGAGGGKIKSPLVGLTEVMRRRRAGERGIRGCFVAGRWAAAAAGVSSRAIWRRSAAATPPRKALVVGAVDDRGGSVQEMPNAAGFLPGSGQSRPRSPARLVSGGQTRPPRHWPWIEPGMPNRARGASEGATGGCPRVHGFGWTLRGSASSPRNQAHPRLQKPIGTAGLRAARVAAGEVTEETDLSGSNVRRVIRRDPPVGRRPTYAGADRAPVE